MRRSAFESSEFFRDVQRITSGFSQVTSYTNIEKNDGYLEEVLLFCMTNNLTHPLQCLRLAWTMKFHYFIHSIHKTCNSE
jgi:hypothetical protein